MHYFIKEKLAFTHIAINNQTSRDAPLDSDIQCILLFACPKDESPCITNVKSSACAKTDF